MSLRFSLWATAAIGLICPSLALAREVTVQVDAAAGPWLVEPNKKLMPYGVGDAKPPVVVPFDIGGGHISIYPTGTTDIAGHTGVPPSGLESDAVDDREVKKKRFPSFYAPKVLYPSNRHALVAVFVDANGKVLGRPLVIGNGLRIPILEGAVAVALGFNDVTFAANRGALTVKLDIPDD